MSMRTISIFVSLIALVWPHIVHAKSVYCVTHQDPARLCAYEVVGDQLTLAGQLFLPLYGYGPIDVTIDSESGILFVTSEAKGYAGGNQIILVDARTLQYIKTISLTNGEHNLSGIVVDELADRVYAVDRDTNRLYTYFWDRDNLELTLDAAMDNPVLLPSITYANGITLDDRTGTLYAAEFSYSPRQYFDTVRLYSRDNAWSMTDTIDLGYSAVDIGEITLA